jgi:hypothetical protein
LGNFDTSVILTHLTNTNLYGITHAASLLF